MTLCIIHSFSFTFFKIAYQSRLRIRSVEKSNLYTLAHLLLYLMTVCKQWNIVGNELVRDLFFNIKPFHNNITNKLKGVYFFHSILISFI